MSETYDHRGIWAAAVECSTRSGHAKGVYFIYMYRLCWNIQIIMNLIIKCRYFPSCVLTVCRILAMGNLCHVLQSSCLKCNNNSSQAKFLYHKILLLWWCQHTPPKLWMVWKESFWNRNQPCILFHEVGQPGGREQSIRCTGVPCRSTRRRFQVIVRSTWRKVSYNIMLLTSLRVVLIFQNKH